MLRALGRLILVPLGVVCGMGVALAILALLGLERITHELARAGEGADRLEVLLELMGGSLRLASAASIVPALLVVLVGEIGRVRSWLYYMVGGGAALASVPLLSRVWEQQAAVLPPTAVWQLFATAGFAGGLVYWLIAGRSA
jgi:hypothetical protein